MAKLWPSFSSVRTRGKVLGENAVSGVTGITNVDTAADGNINGKENVVVDLEEHSGVDTVKGRFDVDFKKKV